MLTFNCAKSLCWLKWQIYISATSFKGLDMPTLHVRSDFSLEHRSSCGQKLFLTPTVTTYLSGKEKRLQNAAL